MRTTTTTKDALCRERPGASGAWRWTNASTAANCDGIGGGGGGGGGVFQNGPCSVGPVAQWRGSNRAVSPRVDDVRATARAMDVVGMIQDARATALGYWQSVR